MCFNEYYYYRFDYCLNYHSVASRFTQMRHVIQLVDVEIIFDGFRMSTALKSDRRATAHLKFLQEASKYNRIH